MKPIIFLIFFYSSISTLFAQRISKISLSSAGVLQTFAITTDDNAATDKIQFSFTMDLQTDRERMNEGDKLLYYGMPVDISIYKAQ